MQTTTIELGYVVGVDIGKLQDPTAISVNRHNERVEVIDERDRQTAAEAALSGIPSPVGGWRNWNRRSSLPRLGSVKGRASAFELVHLDRLPLGTSYPGVVEHVKALMWRPPLRGRSRLVVDATGVGEPIVDMMTQAGLQPVPITITAGYTVQRADRGGWHVPKRDLVDTLAVLFQTERLAIARELRYAQALVDELLAFEARVTAAGRDTYGAREGAHDDLVLATAIAVWYGIRHAPAHSSDFVPVRR